MKTNKYIVALLAGAMVSGFSSCTDSFIEDNAIQGSFNEEVKEYDSQKYTANFSIMQSGIYYNYAGGGLNWVWQLTQCLHHDMFSGYFHDQTSKFNDKNSVYNVNTGWSNAAWNYTYGGIFPVVHQSELLCDGSETALHYMGVTKILKVELMHRISDTYGPIVYSKFGKSEANDVDTQQEAYTAFFKDLDEGIESIEACLAAGYSEDAFAAYDMLNGKTLSGWMKFANSLRLRLAIRVSNVDAALAKSEAKKALESAHGLLETADETIQVAGGSYTNPLNAVSGWGEVYMGASMASILNGYEDPRRAVWFNKATLAGSEDTWLGIPQGVFMKEGDPNHYGGYSALNVSTITATAPAVLMSAAEVWFLRAEAALRGYSSENVQECYETGVKTSFAQWGITEGVDAYLASTKKPLDYEEKVAASGGNDMPALVKVSPKWDSSADKEGKLEQIITQKWIACWPESYEAWSEQRRTGYPRLFKVQTNNSDGAIDTDIMIRRLQFSTDDAANNPAQYDNLVKALGGTDNGGTRLWWDVGENKF